MIDHGTVKGYAQHNRAGSPTCTACKKAWSTYVMEQRKKKTRPMALNNPYTRKYDRALEENPPRITWRRKPNGIWVHTSINDPHAETTVEAQAERLRAAALIAERDRLIAMQDEAREVAARFEQHRANNTRLMQAARTEI